MLSYLVFSFIPSRNTEHPISDLRSDFYRFDDLFAFVILIFKMFTLMAILKIKIQNLSLLY